MLKRTGMSTGAASFVHRGNAQLGIDEQPFPVEGDDLDVQRFDGGGRGACVQRAIGVERVRADPRDRAQGNDDQQRRRPDHQFELDRMVPLRLVRRVRVGRPVAPGEEQRQHDDRHDDEQHQQRRDDQQPRLLHGNIAGRVEHHHAATGQEAGGRQRQQGLHQDELAFAPGRNVADAAACATTGTTVCLVLPGGTHHAAKWAT